MKEKTNWKIPVYLEWWEFPIFPLNTSLSSPHSRLTRFPLKFFDMSNVQPRSFHFIHSFICQWQPIWTSSAVCSEMGGGMNVSDSGKNRQLRKRFQIKIDCELLSILLKSIKWEIFISVVYGFRFKKSANPSGMRGRWRRRREFLHTNRSLTVSSARGRIQIQRISLKWLRNRQRYQRQSSNEFTPHCTPDTAYHTRCFDELKSNEFNECLCWLFCWVLVQSVRSLIFNSILLRQKLSIIIII